MEMNESTITLSDEWPPVDLTRIEPKYLCPACNGIIIRAHQADDCGCRFCLSCLEKILLRGDTSCTSCGQKLTSTVITSKIQKKTHHIC